MSAINSDTREAWQQLANDLGPQRPSVGKRVRVVSGKHLGDEGQVTWHGVDRFTDTRYLSDAQLHLRDMEGRRGFRVRIQSEGENFFVSADKVEVINS